MKYIIRLVLTTEIEFDTADYSESFQPDEDVDFEGRDESDPAQVKDAVIDLLSNGDEQFDELVSEAMVQGDYTVDDGRLVVEPLPQK